MEGGIVLTLFCQVDHKFLTLLVHGPHHSAAPLRCCSTMCESGLVFVLAYLQPIAVLGRPCTLGIFE